MIRRRSWLLWGVIAIVAAVAGAWLAREIDRPGPVLASGTWLPQPRPLGDFMLTDQDGRPFTHAELAGRPTIVFFGFTHCPDVCPTALALLARARKAAELPDLRMLLVSVDPERDTPQVLKPYVRAFDPELVGVTGSPATLEKLAAEFGVAYARIDLPGGDYTIDHSAVLFLLDDQARRVAIFTAPFDSKRLADDLRQAAPHLVTR